MKLVFATNNLHKLQEVQNQLPETITLLRLEDIGCFEDIPETAPTLHENALEKARYVKRHYGYDCFADDTGLEVEALDGAPGVYSARYAGEDKNSHNNIEKLLNELKSYPNRKAQFKTSMALILKGTEYIFEGICKGEITERTIGNNGFGYDPVFIPDGYSKTFAEMDLMIKNTISHRGIAVEKLIAFLKQLH